MTLIECLQHGAARARVTVPLSSFPRCTVLWGECLPAALLTGAGRVLVLPATGGEVKSREECLKLIYGGVFLFALWCF